MTLERAVLTSSKTQPAEGKAHAFEWKLGGERNCRLYFSFSVS